jgi:hypothetical protein
MKGLLMKPWKIKATAEGRATVTRRVIKPQPFMERGVLRWQPKRRSVIGYKGMHSPDINMTDHADLAKLFAHYQVGETVYIKEVAWYGPQDNRVEFDLTQQAATNAEFHGAKKRSPLFMPAWAARYFIKITDVRPERLQDITEEDAKAEGTTKIASSYYKIDYSTMTVGPRQPETYIHAFSGIWDSINKPPYDWDSNCWVWRYGYTLAPNL